MDELLEKYNPKITKLKKKINSESKTKQKSMKQKAKLLNDEKVASNQVKTIALSQSNKKWNNVGKLSGTKKTFFIIAILLFVAIIVFGVFLAFDFIYYNGSVQDGWIWSVERRNHGIFGWWNR
ncbi:hypothetical protein MCAL160_0647 [Mycoplasmopsis californica HAZ160_1]|uniref:Uncharacterized protein n=1 Tax=Mycoplasmopsis californica HAZ160_1 TaxID=1397850 RepID=A0AAT9F8B3_9BACT|nr:hypothetical protein [Mycoplasmopsis californica]BAP01121.1 hypothetical protein MCAL160_0647 [Mycoplasmopsis californica HAZ160_1]BBG40987.1 hypothetical protein MCAL106_0647 [Mycoplasmopsis californica]BBG41580.1 hypothetical protein MCAL106E_0647 [Mycoplasmopsis californica]BBG42174.1 hypothetical protein MCAL106L_0647 [Mycoplasmopsis californica]BBG42756.1 hypothetical protein MCAL160E_0647 [Mycoplasmopsis californica]